LAGTVFHVKHRVVAFFIYMDKLGTKELNGSGVRARSWLMLLGLGLVWGTSFILIKRSLVAFLPEQVACLRIGITSIAFAPVFVWRFKSIDWRRWKQLFVVGFAGSLLPALLFAAAQTKISSSLAGVLSSLTPLFTLLLGISFFKVKATWSKAIGVLLGLVGALWLLLAERGLGDFEGVQYGLLILVGCLFYAISSNVLKVHLAHIPSLAISAASYAMVGIPAIVYLVFSDFAKVMKIHEQAWSSLGYVTILSLTSTVVASVFFFKLIKDTSALFAATVSYLIPVVALGWGVLDGENLAAYHLGGMALILTGVYVARK
jgi:drug/metabolite transporter (DMT)-like permease